MYASTRFYKRHRPELFEEMTLSATHSWRERDQTETFELWVRPGDDSKLVDKHMKLVLTKREATALRDSLTLYLELNNHV